MTTTRTLIGAPTGTIAVDLPVISFADIVKTSGNGTNSGAVDESSYVLAAGDENHPVTFRVSLYNNAGKNGGIGERTTTARVDFYATEVDDASGDVLIDVPASVSITTRVPGINPVFEEADFLAYVLGLASVFFQTVTEDVPDTDVVDKLKYGVSDIL
jgi:hypothetical protein